MNVERAIAVVALAAGMALGRYEGGYDAPTKRLTMVAHFTDPMTWKPATSRAITTFVDASTWIYEEFTHGPDGKDVLTLTIAFKRG